jgi:hypothetical protein
MRSNQHQWTLRVNGGSVCKVEHTGKLSAIDEKRASNIGWPTKTRRKEKLPSRSVENVAPNSIVNVPVTVNVEKIERKPQPEAVASPVEEAQPLGVQLGTAPRHSGSLTGTPTGELIGVGAAGIAERSTEQARLSLTPIGIADHLRFAAIQTDDDVIITKKSAIPRMQSTATQYDAIQFQLFLHDEAMFGAAASFDAGSSRRDSLILPSPSRNFVAQQSTTLLPSLQLLSDAPPEESCCTPLALHSLLQGRDKDFTTQVDDK